MGKCTTQTDRDRARDCLRRDIEAGRVVRVRPWARAQHVTPGLVYYWLRWLDLDCNVPVVRLRGGGWQLLEAADEAECLDE